MFIKKELEVSIESLQILHIKKWHYKKQAVGSMAREEKSYKEAILSRINKKVFCSSTGR